MHAYMSLFAIMGALALGAISPGPSFIFVARNAIALSRQHGVATALGMGSGAFIFSIVALMGLQAVFAAVPFAFWLLKVIGGVYLIYIASKMIRSARNSLAQIDSINVKKVSLKRAYIFGLLTQLSNPKTAVVFASVFSTLLPQIIPTYFYIAIPASIFVVNAGWYMVVALLLSSETPRKNYLRFKGVFDSTAGTVMAFLGLKLLISSSK